MIDCENLKLNLVERSTQSSNPQISQSFDDLTKNNVLALSYYLTAMHCSMLNATACLISVVVARSQTAIMLTWLLNQSALIQQSPPQRVCWQLPNTTVYSNNEVVATARGLY